MAKNTQTQSNVSPAARAELFAQMTRHHVQPIAPVTGAAGGRVSITLPKTRLLSKVRLLVETTLTAVHASLTTYTPAVFAPYTLLSQVRVDTNMGFNPRIMSGRSLYFTTLLSRTASVYAPVQVAQTAALNSRAVAVQGITSSPTAGTVNTVRFMVDVPIALNDRDPIGMILLQNEETNVTIHVDIADATSIAPVSAGYTFTLGAVTITPIVETFSIPKVREAFPDISILRLMHEQAEAITGAGTRDIKLPTGTTYRKLVFFIADAAGVGINDTQLSGDIELVVNTADTPYRINPRVLARINAEHYGMTLPAGLFVFDWSANMGLPNYSGARDYIDTERLSEFWLRFNPNQAGTATMVYETLARLTV